MTERTGRTAGHQSRVAPGAVRGRKPSPVLAFASGFFGGSLIAAVLSFIAVAALKRTGGPSGAVYWIYFSCFLGGFLSGGELRPFARERRWPLLWLAAGSPALPVWIGTIIALGRGVEMAPWVLRLAVIACVAAVAGSVIGYYLTPTLKRWAALPPVLVLRGMVYASFYGFVAILGAVLLLIIIFGLAGRVFGQFKFEGSFALFSGLPLVAGGYASAAKMFPALPRGFLRWPCLVLASPAPYVILFFEAMFLPFPRGSGGDYMEWYLFWMITPVFGSLLGYLAVYSHSINEARRKGGGTRDHSPGGSG